jgi:peptidoglycan/xylan/chitin deacetylase (PgdA/CDA1 family)
MTKEFIIKAALDALHYSGAAALSAGALQGQGVIFCLHHVRPEPTCNFRPNYQLEVTPEFLDCVITTAKAKGYALVSMEEAVSEIKSQRKSAAPFAVFTLDDGYRDNAEFAAPIFRAQNCPYTIFVTPGYAEATADLWWRDLELIVATNVNVASYRTSTFAEKQQAFEALYCTAEALPEVEQRSFVNEIAKSVNFDQAAACRDVVMSWDEIRTLARDPLCTIGAHTMGHFALKRLSASRAADELSASKASIEIELQRRVKYFAYPYGAHMHAGPRDFALAAAAGFEASVTTRKGTICPEHQHHLQALPRLMLSGRYQRKRHVTTLMSGLPFRLSNRLRKLDVT